MLTLYGNAFSPFSRKVSLVLDFKGLEYDFLNALTLDTRETLAKVNSRLEVPAIDHDGLIVVNSADIVAYLDRVFPDKPVFPTDEAERVHVRAWERCADHTIDAILVDISYWLWAIREDERPASLLAAAQRDLEPIYVALNAALEGRDWLAGELGIGDFALFPHLSGTRMLGVPFDGERHPNLLAWYKRCRSSAPFVKDIKAVADFIGDPQTMSGVERNKIFWRGDRLEWMLASGHHQWLVGEIKADRVIWPKPFVPAPKP